MLNCAVCGKTINDDWAIECRDSNDKRIYLCEECAE